MRITLVIFVIYNLFFVASASAQHVSSTLNTKILYLQSYCGNAPATVHSWGGFAQGLFEATQPEIQKLESPKDVRTGYLFSTGKELRLWDLANRKQWTFIGQQFVKSDFITCLGPNTAGKISVKLKEENVLEACISGQCDTIKFLKDTWIYAYAQQKDSLLAISNYGDAMLFRNGAWCRMKRFDGDVYKCTKRKVKMLQKPRGVQFYSSLNYNGTTLVGEWPTGRLYEFDGEQLKPSPLSPPFASDDPIGYEAQSIAFYCGDLYVGYWPTGDIWRLPGNGKDWDLFAQLFSKPDSKAFIPYSDRTPDSVDFAFYGRRVTALVPFGDHLYAATSNLRTWPANFVSPIMPLDEQQEYGAVYRISRPNCATDYTPLQK